MFSSSEKFIIENVFGKESFISSTQYDRLENYLTEQSKFLTNEEIEVLYQLYLHSTPFCSSVHIFILRRLRWFVQLLVAILLRMLLTPSLDCLPWYSLESNLASKTSPSEFFTMTYFQTIDSSVAATM
jgi:hypothetical protein